ncbi:MULTISPECIES: DUF3499 domain-containing protein [unclassified Gordonia (in: high G+C Gram-positive bacteria)]|uniref:DUF3499 domain-containing protein n=1 Tax=unclassified Gordonia (in: high G+C Gram-positive bacteria) TaxID=2657482 RepID=UPI001FFEFAC4|nr:MULTISPECIES: DUF3499 domain-containing protein [unclassified Gordonia (in: high G+C Gram-positive bacteria)]UQE74047.1 DUF3499 domain-containing protein [Gordonia sp. PP30]
MNAPRQCCRPGCSRLAVATLTFVYAESTAVVGPLAGADEPHSWDLCSEHADRITVPRGWELLRSERDFVQPAEDQDLTALADVVREAGAVGGGPGLPPLPSFTSRADVDAALDLRPGPRRGADEPGRHRAERESARSAPAAGPRPGRRGHLRVLPDPVD